ncbi:MAG: hypothetical protein DRQ39_04850 [Gammaproteobacteria bacterium]|nr:MAG: hypothetical protein DRQ39_04850 [Gammaproteobacteria bacterium]
MEQDEVLTHFQSLNRTRIERLRELAPKRQRSFFELLALLFHTNNHILPEFIRQDIPAGIMDFQPSNTQIDAAKELNPSFQFKRHALRHYPITGLYLINSNGLLNYPKQARFDLWLVHATDLSSDQKQALQYKLVAVSEWAATLGITVTSSLLAEDSLNQKSFSDDELDHFYLNGLILAGAVPLWWLIPPDSDYQTAVQTLLKQRMLNKASVIDFGGLASTISMAQSLVDDGVELLDGSIDHGLMYLLPLLHLQYQLQQYPNLPWLSDDLKQAIYQGETDPLQVDCKVLQLKQLERSNISLELLNFARQSFYIQAKERLSQKVSNPKLSWRRDFIADFTSPWSWQDAIFEQLDMQKNAHYQQCLAEHQQTNPVFQEINNSLATFTKRQQTTLDKQHQLIDQKLKLAVDDNPNTIQCLPVGLLAKRHEEHLYLYRFEADGDWKISNITLTSPTKLPLHQNTSLLHILAWAICNQMLTNTTRIKVADSCNFIAISKVMSIVKQLLRSPLADPGKVNTKSLHDSPELSHVLLFANLEQQPTSKLSQKGLRLSSLQNDPLNYANRGESLVASIDGLICSSWGEWHIFSHTGVEAPLEMLTTLIHWWNPQHKDSYLHCWCPSDSYGKAISYRLEKLYTEVSEHYHENPLTGDYLLKIADKFYQLQWQPGSCDFNYLANTSNLTTALARIKPRFSVCKLDQNLDPTGLFSTLLTHQSDSQIIFFLHVQNQTISIYLLDELGGLFQQTYTDLTESTLVNHFHHFLGALTNRPRLRFFRLEQTRNNKWKTAVLPRPSQRNLGYLPVAITMDSPKDSANCTIECGPKHFSGSANDPALFSQVSELMLSLRQSKNDYPLYITQLNFSQTTVIATRDYIIQKQRLENLLNIK